MTFRTFCSGIGAPETAWADFGWRCLSASEIDPQASAVLAARHPGVPNVGDLTTCMERMSDEPTDLVVGGTPCQSFSVAGLRRGLADPRGNLALVYLGLVDRIRPRWVVWENVPGVLSSGRGRDFGAFLGAMGQLGYGFAYRVLDAQYVRVDTHARAVPQRRRRVFVVGYLGDWRRAAAVLLEREGLCGHPPPRREAGQAVAGTLESCAGSGFPGTDGALAGYVQPVTKPLTHRMNKGLNSTLDEGQTVVAVCCGSDPIHLENCALPIACRNGDPGTIAQGMRVRRLTPRECERLQGFPDDYTAIEWRGKPLADGPRYRMLGNSMAVNVMRWIGQRIAAVDAEVSA